MAGKESLGKRELGSLGLVLAALFIFSFFLGVVVGERHERRIWEGKGPSKPHKRSNVHRFITNQKKKPEELQQKKAIQTEPKKGPHLAPGYYIQVMAFKKRVLAERLRDKLQKKGYGVKILNPGTTGLYRVVIGPYHDTKEAERVVIRLKREDKVIGYVVPHTKLH